MRTRRTLRAPAATYAVAGACVLALPATALAAAITQTGTGLHARPVRSRIALGSLAVVDGGGPMGDAGDAVSLEYEPAGSQRWRTMGRSTIASNGRFALRARIRYSGRVRVAARPAASNTAHASRDAALASTPSPSPSASIRVGARLAVTARSHEVLAGRRLTLPGRLLPGSGRQLVRLLERRGGGWRVVASDRTNASGRFRLSLSVAGTGVRNLRVSFPGDRVNAGASIADGRLVGLRATVASYYDDAGDTACGFHAHYGVANRTLPCGTKVTFVHAGRSVTATVDDRGPYVAGRDYDLDEATAAALDMYGVETVYSSR